MDYDAFFKDAIGQVKAEGRYRVFAELERHAGDFPHATNYVGVIVPSEFDIVIKPPDPTARNRFLTVLRAAYKKNTGLDLDTHEVSEFRNQRYRMEKPHGFQLRIPGAANEAANDLDPETRAQLQQSFRIFDSDGSEYLDKTEAMAAFLHSQLS